MDERTAKVVLVTGGSRGMGAEMVHAFAACGANVIIASRKFDNCRVLADKVREQYEGRALPVAFNASNWSQRDDLIPAAYDEFGRVDVLINNAGLSPLYPSLDQVTEDLFDKVIAVNLRGPFRLAAVMGARMGPVGGGS